jgi:DNA-binding NtrC family response regulator
MGDTVLLVETLPEGFVPADPGPPLLGASPAIADLRQRLARCAASPAPVLIQGETGAGKEVAARLIHEMSGRDGPLLDVHCAGVPATLIESELFGHLRGAFTGADRARQGLMVAANRGTLLLDEVGEIPPEVQVKLLRVLERKEVRPLGASAAVPVDVRIVSATNRDLSAETVAGRFRADLYARVAHAIVTVPPLRERRMDILPLAMHFLSGAGSPAIAPDLAVTLLRHPWPGNVRELASLMELAVADATGADRVLRPTPAVLERLAAYSRLVPDAEEPPPDREQLDRLLAETGGNVAEVARKLGKFRAQVYRWVRRQGLSPADYRG